MQCLPNNATPYNYKQSSECKKEEEIVNYVKLSFIIA